MTQNFAERLGWIPKSENLRMSMGRALNYAQERGHTEVTLEHFLLALVDDQNAGAVFAACQVDLERLRGDLTGYINHELQELAGQADGVAQPSEGFKKVMAHASAAAEQSQREFVDGAIVLAALIGEGQSHAAHILNNYGLTFEVAVSTLKNANVAGRSQSHSSQEEMEHHHRAPMRPDEHSRPPAQQRHDPNPPMGAGGAPGHPDQGYGQAPQHQGQGGMIPPPMGHPYPNQQPPQQWDARGGQGSSQIPQIEAPEAGYPGPDKSHTEIDPSGMFEPQGFDAPEGVVNARGPESQQNGGGGTPTSLEDRLQGAKDAASDNMSDADAKKAALDIKNEISSEATVEDILASVREIIGVDETGEGETTPDIRVSEPVQGDAFAPEGFPAFDDKPQAKADIQNPVVEKKAPEKLQENKKTHSSEELAKNWPENIGDKPKSAPPVEQDKLEAIVTDEKPPVKEKKKTPADTPEISISAPEFSGPRTGDAPPPGGMPAQQQERPSQFNQDTPPPPAPQQQGGFDRQAQQRPQAAQQWPNHPQHPPHGGQHPQGQGPAGQQMPPMRRGAPPQPPAGHMQEHPQARGRDPRQQGAPQQQTGGGHQQQQGVGKGQLIENIPRLMRMGVPVRVEVRMARADVQNIERGLMGPAAPVRHDVLVTEAMTVRLSAPKGGFVIEQHSPETQWIDNRLGAHGENYAAWVWNVTPVKRGKKPLQLGISARIAGEQGIMAQSALPDQRVTVSVRINYLQTFKSVFGWLVIAALGGIIGKYGETLLELTGLAP